MIPGARAGVALFVLASVTFVGALAAVPVAYALEDPNCANSCFTQFIGRVVAGWLLAGAAFLAGLALLAGLEARAFRWAAIAIAVLGGAYAAWTLFAMTHFAISGRRAIGLSARDALNLVYTFIMAGYALTVATVALALFRSRQTLERVSSQR